MYLDIIETDLAARVGEINGIKTPAMSLVSNYKYVIFESFSQLKRGKKFELDPANITHFPHLIPQYKEDVVKKSLEDFAKNLGGREIISISYYPNPSIYESLREIKPSYVIVRDLQTKRSPRNLLGFLIGIRKIIPEDSVLHIVSPIPWEYLPFIIYLGVDIVDVGPFFLKLYKEGINAIIGHSTIFLLEDIDNVEYSSLNEEEKIPYLEKKNQRILDSIFKRFRRKIENGSFREIIEVFSHINQTTDSILAYLDNNYVEFFKQRVSVRKPRLNIFVGMESFSRPIIKWYDERIYNRYFPPSISKITILLPCAARKPYSFSKSHQLFKRAINLGAAGKLPIIHELMLTSPIGIVPRELEMTYPNAHYDTTTTGNWNEWEIEHTAKLLENYLEKIKRKNGDHTIIVHLDGGYKLAATRALQRMNIEYIDTSNDKHVTDTQALEKLADTLRDITDGIDVDIGLRKERIREDTEAILSYQYGPEIAKEFLRESEIMGGPYSKQGYQIKNMAIFDKNFGFFIPLKKGAELMSSKKTYTVKLSLETITTGSYVSGSNILKADHNIQPGDIIVLASEDEKAIGVGISLFSGESLEKIEKSRGVNVLKVF
ncbi:MAG: DUF5591 domain-containing protein [Candidatus Njordarchaeia archaeon]